VQRAFGLLPLLRRRADVIEQFAHRHRLAGGDLRGSMAPRTRLVMMSDGLADHDAGGDQQKYGDEAAKASAATARHAVRAMAEATTARAVSPPGASSLAGPPVGGRLIVAGVSGVERLVRFGSGLGGVRVGIVLRHGLAPDRQKSGFSRNQHRAGMAP